MDFLKQLEMARQELLDMGLRGNSLLHLPKNKKYLDVIEEHSEDIFQILVEQKQAMKFKPIPEVYEQEEDSRDEDDLGGEVEPLPPLEQYLDETEGDARFHDRFLQTSLTVKELDARLLKIESEAHALLQEQGIEVLYLALGMLQWYEDPNASTPRYAPLVLIPVALDRQGAGSQFGLSFTEADLGPNLTLAAKLKGEFRIELPDFDDEFDINAYFSDVEEKITSQSRWKVLRNKICLGLFSFGKFQMFMDLDPERWPEEAPLAESQQLSRIFGRGFSEDAGTASASGGSRYICAPEEMHLVKDADSSQLEAIVSVMEGANLVIQGPPGTGKSQTITNIIAEAVAREKKVLFVAQKMAALEVVKTRLDESSLGDAVLELHSHKSNKKSVLDSLKKVFEQGVPEVPDRAHDYGRLKEVKSQLNGYIENISEPILKSGLNYIQALGYMLALKKIEPLKEIQRIDFSLLSEWNEVDFQKAQRAMMAVEDHYREYESPAANPYFGSTKNTFSPTEAEDLQQLIKSASRLLEKLQSLSSGLAEEMLIPVPETLSDVRTLHRAGLRALEAPHLKGVKVSTAEWQARRDDIKSVLAAGARMTGIRGAHDEVFIEAAFEADVLPIRMGLAGRADKWWRIFSSEYRKAKTGIRGYMKGDLQGKATDWLAWVDEILEYQKLDGEFRQLEPMCEALFGAQWQGLKSDWEVLEGISRWIVKLYQSIGAGEIPAGITDFLEADPDISERKPDLEELERLTDRLRSTTDDLVRRLVINHELITLPETLSGWRRVLASWDDTSALYQVVRFNQLETDIEQVGLKSLLPLLRDWRHSAAQIANWVSLSYYSGLVDHAYAGKPAIGRFDRITHERLLEDFRKLDSSTLGHAQESLVKKLHGWLPSKNAPGEMEVLRREFSKKRRHMPLRRLMAEAGNVIQQAKPIFMMSPMSVATYLPQGMLSFDLVVFDEASQIQAPEALGAIARGSQTVVVGDSKQMPPTNFFAKSVELSDDEAEESGTADIESILGLMEASGAPDKMLRWHYRSRHDSLIAVSNDQFYENKLLIFPSPGVNTDARGLRLRHVPEGIYDRGGSRANVIEAKRVAEAVMEHARTTPHLTLGVVAFSSAQRDVIMLEVERLRRESPETETFFQHHMAGDEFFIKNLENVQGDERDVIFISVGYGKTATGKLGQNFGPLNTKGGERRLNVLISRSRLAMDVFANFTADELRTEASSPFGVRAFKAFLKYAESGELEQRLETGREADSPFEVEVHKSIEAMGYEVEPQVGTQGFFIDLAVRCPEKPGRFILAVECDGASYHSSAVARDRDRLRQSVLEGLGWRFHRIWSTEWFRNQAAEEERLENAIKRAISHQKSLDDGGGQASKIASVIPESPVIERKKGGDEASSVPAYELVNVNQLGIDARIDFHSISSPKIASAILQILELEGPAHFQTVCSRILQAAKLGRAGSKIQKRLQQVLGSLVGRGDVVQAGEFYWLYAQESESVLLPVRTWANLEASERKLEYVPDIELANAMFLMVRDGHSVSINDCMSAALDLIGFKRLTKGTSERLEALCRSMINEGWLKFTGDRLQLGESSEQFNPYLVS